MSRFLPRLGIIATYPYYHLGLPLTSAAMLCFWDVADVDTKDDSVKHSVEEQFTITTMHPGTLFDLATNKRPKKWGAVTKKAPAFWPFLTGHISMRPFGQLTESYGVRTRVPGGSLGTFPMISKLNAGADTHDPNHDANEAALSVGDLLLAIDDVPLGDETVEDVLAFLVDLGGQIEAGTHPNVVLLFRRRDLSQKSAEKMLLNLGKKFGHIAKYMALDIKPRKKIDQNFDEFGDPIGTGEAVENAKLAAEYSEISDVHLPAMWNRIITSMLGREGSPELFFGHETHELGGGV